MNTDTQPALEVLARRRLELTAKRDDIDQAIADVDRALMDLLAPGESALIDNQPVWTVRPGNRRWNEDKAREALPGHVLDSITVTETRLDPKVAREVLPPALYAQCTVDGKPFVAKAGRK